MKLIQVHQTSFKIHDGEYSRFWKDVNNGEWESFTFNILDKYLSEKPMIDIGAWIGPVTLYAQNFSSKILALEPDKTAFAELEKNIQLNHGFDHPNIIIENAAVHHTNESIKLFHRTSKGDSMSSFLSRSMDNGSYELVQGITLKKLIQKHKIDDIGLIKIDIEGGEFTLFPYIKDTIIEYQPVLVLSLHTPFLLESYLNSFIKNINLQKKIINLNVFLSKITRVNFLKILFYFKLKRDISSLQSILRNYKYIYDKKGNAVKYENIVHLLRQDMIVATNSKW